MVHIGDFNSLTVTRTSSKGGCYLDGEKRELYLPKGETPKHTRTGDTITVFVYNESKNQLGVTTQTPKAKVGDFAALEVKTVTSFGAFLDWGIGKDLFVPKKNWTEELRVGEVAVVYLTLDYEKKGVMGTCNLSPHFSEDTAELQPNQKVNLLVYEKTGLGFQVVVDNTYKGLVYHDEIFKPISVGQSTTGYVKKVREDGQLDIALHPQGFRESTEKARQVIMGALDRSGGFLPLSDKSTPQDIRDQLNISKKVFKKTIGVLYKEGTISITESGIEKKR
jgi:predicted RNA-binding protein (virulence factor B family)